jgi:Holliday junction resolvase RusA-like endonuclease
MKLKTFEPNENAVRASCDFFVHEKPRPQARPRTGKYHNFYSPKTKFYYAVLEQAKEQAKLGTFSGAVSLKAGFYFGTKDTKKMGQYHICRPDLDNLVKAVKDAITAAKLWTDDSIVCTENLVKRYVVGQASVGVKIQISKIIEGIK